MAVAVKINRTRLEGILRALLRLFEESGAVPPKGDVADRGRVWRLIAKWVEAVKVSPPAPGVPGRLAVPLGTAYNRGPSPRSITHGWPFAPLRDGPDAFSPPHAFSP